MMTIKTGFESDESQCQCVYNTSNQNVCHQTESALPADLKCDIFSAKAEQRVSQSSHTHASFLIMPTVIVFVFLTAVLPLFVCFLCQQVLRGGQVFPKKQHDFVSNGL